ncbi:outer membrane protein assembly factor BamE [Psychrobacter sp. F1192]|uniref:Outer membrane protein assembly factor BamE n=1 Tax=Psychrobacter coccoides TaxID=2818440 RepID=A0ABS3NR11_9GAMM|nr:outer membrane protein assembly factor BamE [Psychrobacter coccoides]MBO1531661.1 outer membrane protein assembly factor BamE [Psychrobacter coccoides]
MIKPLTSLSLTLSIPDPAKTLRKLMITATLGATVALSGCSLFSVYKIDLPQGTPITQTQAQKLQVGMNQNQVLYILGSPAIRDTLAPNRWDYIYDYQAGTQGERDGIADVKNASQHLIIYFDDSGIVNRIEGIESLPES